MRHLIVTTETMKNIYKLACLFGASFATMSSGFADDWQQRSVFTTNGIVQFVSAEISAEDLAEISYPTQKKERVLTRSIFENTETNTSVEPTTAVAMLIQFEFDSAVLTSESKRRLNTFGDMLNIDSLSKGRLSIEGHTDIVGSSEYNLGLSIKRAESVKQYLISNHKVHTGRLEVSGKGESQLIDLENPRGPVNRRVQFYAAPGRANSLRRNRARNPLTEELPAIHCAAFI